MVEGICFILRYLDPVGKRKGFRALEGLLQKELGLLVRGLRFFLG